MKTYTTTIKVRFAAATWTARASIPTELRVNHKATATASSTSLAEVAAKRAAAKALRCEEDELTLVTVTVPLWNRPGSFTATREERREVAQ